MDLNTLAAAERLVGRLLRKALIVLVMALCAVVAIYHFTIAGNIALAGHFGDFNARLIIGTIYGAMALISLVILWAMRGKPAKFNNTSTLNSLRARKLAMLAEAAVLGYSLARKGERAR